MSKLKLQGGEADFSNWNFPALDTIEQIVKTEMAESFRHVLKDTAAYFSAEMSDVGCDPTSVTIRFHITGDSDDDPKYEFTITALADSLLEDARSSDHPSDISDARAKVAAVRDALRRLADRLDEEAP